MSVKKQYDPGFKAKLAIGLISDKKTVLEIGSEHKVPQTNLHEWKTKLLDSAKEVFLPESERNKQLKILEQEINGLHKIIGEITEEFTMSKKPNEAINQAIDLLLAGQKSINIYLKELILLSNIKI